MVKRILCFTLSAILCLGLAVPVLAITRNGVHILDETGNLSDDHKSSLQQEAKLYSKMARMDILYVRTNEQELEAYAGGLHLGERHDQVMLIENDEVQKVLFFGKAQLLTQRDAQELLDVYTAEADGVLGIYRYLEAAWAMISKGRSEGVFNRVLEENLEQMPRLQDNARLLSSGDRRVLSSKLDELSQRQEMDVLLLTVENLGTKSAWEHADKFYRNHVFGTGENKAAILLLVEDEQCWLFVLGSGNRAFTDDGINYISKQIKKEMKKEGYDRAFHKYAELCDAFITQARSGEPYGGANMPKTPFRLGLYLVISILAGIAAGGIVLFRHKDELKSVQFHYDAEDYIENVDTDTVREQKIYLYSTTDRRLKS